MMVGEEIIHKIQPDIHSEAMLSLGWTISLAKTLSKLTFKMVKFFCKTVTTENTKVPKST